MASWLRGHVRLSPAAAGQLVRNGRALEHLPAVAAACTEGVVTAEQVAVIAPVTKPENVAAAAELDVDLGVVDAVLAETAATRQHVQLGRVVHHYVSRLDPDGPEPDPSEGRSLLLARHSDGSRSLSGHLDAVGGEKLETALEALVPAGRTAGDTRTRAQQLGDAIVQLADNALAAGNLPILRTVKPQVILTIPLADLVAPSIGPGAAETGFGATLSATRARWAACDGTLTRLVLDPDGIPLDHGRTKRLVSPQLRRRSNGAMGTASSPAAKPRATGVTSIMCSSGSTEARPAWRTPPCSANATTPRSTTASASNDNPRADGAPGGPTARRSCSIRSGPDSAWGHGFGRPVAFDVSRR